MNQYTPADMPELPRFWGGIVGYLTYEMVSFFERIPNQWPEEKPLAHFIMLAYCAPRQTTDTLLGRDQAKACS